MVRTFRNVIPSAIAAVVVPAGAHATTEAAVATVDHEETDLLKPGGQPPGFFLGICLMPHLDKDAALRRE